MVFDYGTSHERKAAVMEEAGKPNPLGTAPIGGLMLKYAVPSVVSMLVMSLYNIVDQIFIGWGVGYLGNAATTVTFPLTVVGLAIALLTGVGSGALISLGLGRGDSGGAKKTLGNALLMLAVLSVVLVVLSFAFLRPLLELLGGTEAVLPYAVDYASYILIGLPFAMCSAASSHVIRADGSPRYSMFCTLSGAVLNTILDPIFIFVFHMGVKGAAIATAISQIFSFMLVVYYLLRKAKYVRLSPGDFKPDAALIRKIAGLGSSSFANQASLVVVNIALNRSLIYYGAASPYGGDVPLAAMGIVMKINQILIATLVGVCTGVQPIYGFNYGAKNFDRVKETFRRTVTVTGVLAAIVNILFMTVPQVFIGIFGDANALFNEFACRALSVFMCCVFAAGIQIPSSTFFIAIGKPLKAMTLSMTRQLLALIPMLLLLPLLFGLDGVLYSGPAADIISVLVTLYFIIREMRFMGKPEENPASPPDEPEAVPIQTQT